MGTKNTITRRQLLIGSATLALAACAAPAGGGAAAPAAPAAGGAAAGGASVPAPAAGVAAVPRNRTLIMAGLGGEEPGAFTDVENFNWYTSSTPNRSGLVNAGTEGLWYANMLNVTELIPWLAESSQYNADFTEFVIKLRNGIEWSDGEPFTANDIVFCLNTMMANKTMKNSGDLNIYVDKAEVVDNLTVKLTFKKSSPRFQFSYLVFWADFGIPFNMAEHVWKDQADPTTFSNYDPAKGWPLVTGPYKLVGRPGFP
jgi:peptide/nickel transport system substrate-binding protein